MSKNFGINECIRLSNFKFPISGGQFLFHIDNFCTRFRFMVKLFYTFSKVCSNFIFVSFHFRVYKIILCSFFISSQKFSLLDDHKFVNEKVKLKNQKEFFVKSFTFKTGLSERTFLNVKFWVHRVVVFFFSTFSWSII